MPFASADRQTDNPCGDKIFATTLPCHMPHATCRMPLMPRGGKLWIISETTRRSLQWKSEHDSCPPTSSVGRAVRYNFRHPTDVLPVCGNVQKPDGLSVSVYRSITEAKAETEAIAPACKTIAGNFSLRMSPPAAACELTMNIHSECVFLCVCVCVSVLEQRVRALTSTKRCLAGCSRCFWQSAGKVWRVCQQHQTDIRIQNWFPPPTANKFKPCAMCKLCDINPRIWDTSPAL